VVIEKIPYNPLMEKKYLLLGRRPPGQGRKKAVARTS
jgi:hypothetical protein